MDGTQNKSTGTGLARRRFIIAGGAAIAAPFVLKRPALAAGEVIVRTPGGAYEEVMRRIVYEPFRQETGIQITPVAASMSKLLAMIKTNNIELDVIDTGDGPLSSFAAAGALAPIQFDKWKLANPDSIDVEFKSKTHVAVEVYSSVLAYNTKTFPNGNHPKSWADFWNVGAFPGQRSLADMASYYPSLEFALLADGVPKDKLYPLDLDRAFKSLSRIRPNIRKFWDTGALSAQLLTDNEVSMGHIWSSRLQPLIQSGAPLGLEWNENMIQVQALAIFKGSPNEAAAQRFVEYMLQPKLQAKYVAELASGPTNKDAFAFFTPEQLANLPGGQHSRDLGFFQDVVWWEINREKVNNMWSKWILG